MSRLVVADTGPLNYLIQIGHIDILPAIFEQVILPQGVRSELLDPRAPWAVQNWAGALPAWIEVRTAGQPTLSGGEFLGPGEAEAIAIALEMDATLVLLDDRVAVTVARSKGLRVTGTLGLLKIAAENGLLVLRDAFERIRRTNFHAPDALYDQLLADADPDTGRSR